MDAGNNVMDTKHYANYCDEIIILLLLLHGS